MRDAVEAELDCLEEEGVLEKVSHSECIVVVPKKDGKIILCADYKVTVNQSIWTWISILYYFLKTSLPRLQEVNTSQPSTSLRHTISFLYTQTQGNM